MRRHLMIAVLGMEMVSALIAQTVPTTINYQGRLTDNTPAQTPVSATVQMQFALYDAPAGGTRLWQEPAANSTGTSITVTNGVFSYVLGNAVALPSTVFTGATSIRYLQVTLNPAGSAEILSPRQLITATGYAKLAQSANSAATATTATSLAANGSNCAAGNFPLGVDASGGSEGCTAASAHTHNAADVNAGNLAIARLPAGGNWALASNLTFDTSTLALDIANNRVGIGAAAPAFPLDVTSILGNTNARFGTTDPLFIVSNTPNVGFNAYYNGGWFYGSTRFAGILNYDTFAGGFNFSTAPSGTAGTAATLTSRLAIGNSGRVSVDPTDINAGNLTNGALLFGGAASGEGIASKRTAGGNQYGLELITGNVSRLSISNNGNLGIGATPGERLEVAGPDATARIHNTNDTLGAFAGNTFSSLQLGLYNPTGTVNSGVPANTKRSYFGIEPSTGKVGSLTNNFGAPVFRNLLDEGNGVISAAGGYRQPGLGGEVLRILKGSIYGSGSIFYGTGFTVSKGGTGRYTIYFDTDFSPDPVITVTPRGCDNCAAYVSWTNQYVTIEIRYGGILTDYSFAFIAIGPP